MNEFEKQIQEAKDKIAPLKAKYPRVFSKIEYVSCEEGWFPLIENLSENIERYIDLHVPNELQDQVYYEDIKQKFGGLRVHMNHYIDYIQGAVAMTESVSYRVCEKCSEKGQTYNVRSWITTLCPKHHEEALNRRHK